MNLLPSCHRRARLPRARGFTLVEMLVATTLTLLMMATVATIFTRVSDSMRDSRSTVGMNDRLRSVKNRLQSDLAGVTVTMLPPRRPEWGEGYFEYIEGPIGPVVRPTFEDPPGSGNFVSELEAANLVAPNLDGTNIPDTTLGDNDDILMFTTRNLKEPFIGRFGNDTIQSTVAEVCWFVRGTTLYRRVLLVAPATQNNLPQPGDAYYYDGTTKRSFYAGFDVSVREEGETRLNRAPNPGALRVVPNSLADLTKRENRFAHQPYAFPHDARFWSRLGLPTLRETSDPNWPFPISERLPPPLTPPPHPGPLSPNDSLPAGAHAAYVNNPAYQPDLNSQYIVPNIWSQTAAEPFGELLRVPLVIGPSGQFDAWTNPHPWTATDPATNEPQVNAITGTMSNYSDGARIAEDVILTNVLAFDVKAWDPGAPIFADTNGNAIMPGDADYIGALATAPIAFGAYVDLNYMCRLGGPLNGPPSYPMAGVPQPYFHGAGDPRSRVRGTEPTTASVDTIPLIPAVYDTWSFHYEHDGIDQDPGVFMNGGVSIVDQATDGLDNSGMGGVDDESEWETAPPYRAPLRGIQVKIRVFDPDSRQIREVTIRQDFLPE